MPVVSNHLIFTLILAVYHGRQKRPADESVSLFMLKRWQLFDQLIVKIQQFSK